MLNITQDLFLNKIFGFSHSYIFRVLIDADCYQRWTRYNLFVVVVLYVRCLSRKLSLNSIIFLKNQLTPFHLKYFFYFVL